MLLDNRISALARQLLNNWGAFREKRRDHRRRDALVRDFVRRRPHPVLQQLHVCHRADVHRPAPVHHALPSEVGRVPAALQLREPANLSAV